MRNRLLETPVLVTMMPKAGGGAKLSMEGLRLGDGESYRLDLDNGTLTQWMVSGEGGAIEQLRYREPGTYYVKARVRTADGNVTGWSDPVVIEVSETGSEGDEIADTGRFAVLIMAMFIIATILVWSMMRSFG